MKKIRSLNLNTKLILLGAILSLGYVGTVLLNNLLKDIYISNKLLLQERIEKVLNKKVYLGDYSGIRLFGISLKKIKIINIEDTNSEINAEDIYVGLMPIKSFLNQNWSLKIRPKKTFINVRRDFFKKERSINTNINTFKFKTNYGLNIKLPRYSILKLNDIGIDTKVKGGFVYSSNKNQITGNLISKFEGKGNLKLKFYSKLNKNIFKLKVFTGGINIGSSKYEIGNRIFSVKKGNFKSDFRFFKSPSKTYCEGRFSLNKLALNNSNLSEDIISDSIGFNCKDNYLEGETDNLNYGTLNSFFKIKVPLNESLNNINITGNIGYLNSLNPDIKLSANLPYWIDKRGINIGNLYSSFDLNRTQLSNLNIFRNNSIRGFVTAKGELKGKLNQPNILINFNIDYPHYKGIRIREIWEGEIKNKKKGFILNMKNRYSPIPSFLSINFDSLNKLESAIFSRVFNTNRGSLKIAKNEDSYTWNASNFPLDELELAINNNQFNRISGIINGEGLISKDQSNLDGRLAWSAGKYRNIKFTNSIFNFTLNDKSFYAKSSIYPIDGGVIEAEYDSNEKILFSANFDNISTDWSILTAVDIFNFDNKKVVPTGKSKALDDLQISNDDMSFEERIEFINGFLEKNIIFEDKIKLKSYLSKIESRYDAKLIIEGDNLSDYKINTKLNGYVNALNIENKNSKDKFNIDLQGGLLKGKGLLKIKNLPLNAINIFLDKPKEFQGGLDMNLSYNLDSRTFSSDIKSNNTSIKNNQITLKKGLVNFNKSIFDIDFSLLLNDSTIPINFEGSIPINKEENLDLRLIGNGKFIELIDILVDDYFTFNKGDVNIRMIANGTWNEPILNGFIVIKDTEIDFYNNLIKDINGLIIFDFDYFDIKNLEASLENSGNIYMKGSLPFYSKSNPNENVISLKTSKFNINSNNINFLVDSDVEITGSFEKPLLGGSIALNNGFINFNNNKKNNKKIKSTQEVNGKKNWPELYWDINKKIEIISNETILNSVLLGENLPKYLENLSFKNLKLKLGPDFRLQYSEIVKAYLDTRLDLNINGTIGEDLNARGLIDLKRGRANLYTTPFKLDKNKENYILFASRSGVVPYINFSLVSKVPDSIIPINENNYEKNISGDLNTQPNSAGFGAFGIGNTRLIKIEASYEGFLDQLSFEDKNQRIKLRSTPSYNRSQIIGLIGGNSANLINRAFISQFNSAEAFSERFQLSLYPALVENKDSMNNVFVNENIDTENNKELDSSQGISSQAWVAELGLDITDTLNFAFQTIPGRDDLPPLGIFTFQANPNLELLGSFDSDGEWKSQFQLFFRY